MTSSLGGSKAKKARKGTSNKGPEYEVLLPALFSLELLEDTSIKDFVMSSNVQDFGNFDDLLISLTRTDDVVENYAFQLKHKEAQNKKLNPLYLENRNHEFGLLKYCEQYSKIAEKNEYNFIIYTNGYFNFADEKVVKFNVVEDGECPGKKYFSRSQVDAKAIYNFRVNKDTAYTDMATKEVYESFFKKFALYTHQKDFIEVEKSIIELFQDESTAVMYINVFKRWKLHLFSKVEITRRELQILIFDILLSPHIITTPNKTYSNKCTLLEAAMKKFDFTIIKDLERESLEKLISDTYDNVRNVLRVGKNLKFLTKEMTDNCLKKDIELQTKIRNKIGYYEQEQPIIINITEINKASIINSILKCKEKQDKLHMVLWGTNVDRKDFYGFDIFETLHDLQGTSIFPEIVKKLKIFISRKEYLYEELFEFTKEVEERVTIKEIFEMLMGNFKLEVTKENLANPYITRLLTTTLIKTESLDEIWNDVLVISCKGSLKSVEPLEKILVRRTFMEIDEYLKREIHSRSVELVLFKDKQISKENLEQIYNKNPSKNIHHLEVYDEEFLEWISSIGSIEELKKCKIVKRPCVIESNIYEHFQNRINVIVARPGMGKSEMLKNFKNLCPSEFFPIKIILKEHNPFFSKEHSDEEILNYLLNLSNDGFLQYKAKEGLARMKRIIFFFDGIDELYSDHLNVVLNNIKQLSSMGFRIWTTSRPNLLEIIERHLNVFAIEIDNFNEREEKRYIKQRLHDNLKNVDRVVNQIYQNFKTIVKNRDILDVPLQLFIITEILIQNSHEVTTDMFVLTHMFRNFIIGRYKHFFNKRKCTHFNSLEEILKDSKAYRMEQYQIASLESCLTREEFQVLNLKQDKKFLEQIKKEGDFLGIISEIIGNMVIFNHHIYVEYFAALWLTENWQDIQGFIKTMIFREKYSHIKLMFDMILAENCPAHIAILYRNIDELRKHKDKIDRTDKGGRATLHLACSHACRYPTVNDFQHEIINYETINNIRGIDREYKEIFNCLLEAGQDPLRVDSLFEWDSLNYADNSFFLLPLEIILKKYEKTFDYSRLDILKNHKKTIVYYAALFSYTNLFKMLFSSDSFNSDEAKHLLLLATTTSDNWEIVNLLLRNQVDIQSTTVKEKRTPLHLAALHGHVQTVTLLLLKGADIEAEDQYGGTPLHLAVTKGHIQTIKELFKNGANVDPVDKYGRTPLHLSIEEGKREVVEFLLNKKADSNKAAWNGWTPLHLAVMEGHVDIVHLLLERGAVFDKIDSYGTKPLHIAAKRRNVDIIKMLLNKTNNVDEITANGRTSLHLAAEFKHVEGVRFLLENGANINACDNNGKSVLHWAVIGGNVKIVELLLDRKGIVIDAEDNNGRSSLQWASELGAFDIVELLIKKKVGINDKAKTGSTALHWAAYNGHNRIVKLLVDNYADVNVMDAQQKTPLYWAASKGQFETVQLLLEENAQEVFFNGKTALEYTRTIRK